MIKLKKFVSSRIEVIQHKSRKQQILNYLTFGFVLLSFPLILLMASFNQQSKELRGRASNEQRLVRFFMLPKDLDTPKGKSLSLIPKLLAPKDKQISSILVTFTFNKSHLKLTKIEIVNQVNNLYVLKSTSVEDANSRGVVKLFMGVESKEKALSAADLPPLNFEVLTEDTSSINLDKSVSQIVFSTKEEAEIEVDGQTTINSKPRPTPTLTPLPSATPFPTAVPPTPTKATPIATLTPTDSPSITPTFTSTPLPVTLSPGQADSP